MTEKALIKKVKALGGMITENKCVDFLDIRITNKQQAQDILEVLRYANNLQDTADEYSCSLDEPLDALIAWLKDKYGNETKDDLPETAQEQGGDIEEEEPLHLFDVDPAGLQRMFRDFDEATKAGTT
jgi:hypothetical protein